MNEEIKKCPAGSFNLWLILLCLPPGFYLFLLILFVCSPPQRPELGTGGPSAKFMGKIAQQVREAVWGPAGCVWPLQEHGQVPQHPEQPEHAAAHHPTVPSGQEGPHLFTRRWAENILYEELLGYEFCLFHCPQPPLCSFQSHLLVLLLQRFLLCAILKCRTESGQDYPPRLPRKSFSCNDTAKFRIKKDTIRTLF